MQFFCTDSLVKIFPQTKKVRRLKYGGALLNERYCFQLFLRSDEMRRDVVIRCSRPDAVTLYAEDFIPAVTVTLPGADDYTVGETGLYPDLLRPLGVTDFFLRAGIACPVFAEVDCRALGAGRHRLTFTAECAGETLAETAFTLTGAGAESGESDLIVTDWLHCDCIADYYGVPVNGRRYFALVENFIRTAVAHGINTVFVPCFTPPLDTAVGHHRTNVQLVGVTEENGAYSFDFSALETFIAIAKRAGAEYFEVNHLFSQWGAKACPDVYIRKNGRTVRCFGHKTAADSTQYRAFLRAFLPALDAKFKEWGIAGRALYHLSDEPNGEHLERYRSHLAFIKEVLPDCRVMDALSDFAYRDIGIDLPVVAIDACEPFFASGADIMVYYCTGQDRHFEPNSFFCTPSERNRVLGVMLYKYGARGFLHWGYNFYSSYLSLRTVDPFYETDSAGRYQAGDAFRVYPEKEGALASLRLKVFRDGLQDYCLLKAVERKKGRAFVCSLLQERGFESFFCYPHDGEALLRLHDEFCALLAGPGERS